MCVHFYLALTGFGGFGDVSGFDELLLLDVRENGSLFFGGVAPR